MNAAGPAVSKFTWPVRVYYEDTDLGGVVYYANYLKFMERARTEWLRAAGIEQDRLLAEHGALFVIVSCDVRYHAPARFNEMLEVNVNLLERRSARFVVGQEIWRGAERLVSATVTAACIDATSFRPRPIPEGIIPETLA